jgi:hypothetical protein
MKPVKTSKNQGRTSPTCSRTAVHSSSLTPAMLSRLLLTSLLGVTPSLNVVFSRGKISFGQIPAYLLCSYLGCASYIYLAVFNIDYCEIFRNKLVFILCPGHTEKNTKVRVAKQKTSFEHFYITIYSTLFLNNS